MKKTSYNIFQISCLLFMLSATACSNLLPISRSGQELPAQLSPNSVVISSTTTPQIISNLLDISLYTPLIHQTEFILYLKKNSQTNLAELWTINPNKLIPTLIMTGKEPIYSWGWSPSGKLWLLSSKNSIYIADFDGTNVRNIFSEGKYISIYPFWMADGIVLVNAFSDMLIPPDVYSINTISGKATKVNLKNKFIQSVFPQKNLWLQVDWNSRSIEVARQNQDPEKIFDNFYVTINPFDRRQIQIVNKQDKIIFGAKRNGDIGYKLWLGSLQNSTEYQELFDPGDGGIDYFSISPDEKYLAFTYVTLENTYLDVIDMQTLQISYHWIYPYTFSSTAFIWAPDSHSIVLSYSDTANSGNTAKINSGIQIMDITTGKTREVLKENVIQILDWHYLK